MQMYIRAVNYLFFIDYEYSETLENLRFKKIVYWYYLLYKFYLYYYYCHTILILVLQVWNLILRKK